MTRASPVTLMRLVKNALLEPETASTTLLPVLAQSVRAFWTRVVSSEDGGEDRCEVLNCAVSVMQTAGFEGWATVRVSPVASVCAARGSESRLKVRPAREMLDRFLRRLS